MNLDINLCTFRRPEVVDTLASIDDVIVPDGVYLRVIVIDNDVTPTAEQTVRDMAARMRVPVVYLHAPSANIALARNAGLQETDADWVIFVDDDEMVQKTWLQALFDCQAATGADAVFGNSIAQYPADTPRWIVEQDHHSNIVKSRAGVVETGYTCNALLRWHGTPWTNERFDLARGKSGGEDTEFFFRLRKMGAQYAIAKGADVFETIAPNRLTFDWLRRRKYRMGQTYSSKVEGISGQIRLFLTALAKTCYCHARALLAFGQDNTRKYWRLRGALHLSVCAGCLSLPIAELY